MSLTVTDIRLSRVRLELVHDFETSSHRKSALEHIIVRATATDGERDHVGWGECASPSDPYYCAEITDTCWHMLSRYFTPMLIGRSWSSPAEAASLFHSVSGNNFARAGLEMACWDLYAKARRQSLARSLTTNPAHHVEAGVSLGIEPSIDALLTEVDRHVTDGYRRVKLKIRRGWDVEPVAAVCSAFPSIAVQVDANGSYDSDDLDHLAGLDGMGLLMVEQPFAPDDLLTHAALVKRTGTPVCMDESITSIAALRTALAVGACSIVNIKVSRLGGLGPARDVHDLCHENGVPAWCGGMHEFGVGRAANLAVASLPGFVLPSDVSGSDKYYRHDIVAPPIRANGGLVPTPLDRPGLGVVVDEELLDEHTMETFTLGVGSGPLVKGPTPS